MAPEQLERKYYSKAVDIWSCGILMYMLCNSGSRPFKEKSDSVLDYFLKLKSPMWKLEGCVPSGVACSCDWSSTNLWSDTLLRRR